MKKFRLQIFLMSIIFLGACNKPVPLEKGFWYSEIIREDGVKIPFIFEVLYQDQQPQIAIINGKERIDITEITINADTIFMVLPYFNTEIKASISKNKKELTGIWTDPQRENYQFKWTAKAGKTPRFESVKTNTKSIEGKWQAFFPEEDSTITPAILLINIEEEKILATFQTETGDYRFLEGVQRNDSLFLSVFDGSHAYLFIAQLKGNTLMNGKFYAGLKHAGKWSAIKNQQATLRNPSSLSKIISNQPIQINITDLDGKPFIIDSNRLQNKVTFLQIMGTWCPNCLDEARFVKQLLKDFDNPSLQALGLSFERSAEFKVAQPILQKYERQLNLQYPILYAGKSGRKEAATLFPMLDTIVAFPTLIITDKKGFIREVHSGFNGPATGEAYTHFKEETYQLIQKMLSE